MNGTVGTLTIEMAANIVRLQQDMDKAKKTVDNAMGSVEKSIDRVTTALGAIAGAFSVQAFTTKLIQVQREFDILNSSLITVTGSSRNAEIEFAWIKNFAATTPFSLAEVTSAFIKMKALGLDASADALKAYGNTASAMGKSLNDLIEAIADAATGEFERLKEFGIKANAEGDRVTLTFRGVSTNIGKNAAEITQYLRSIGEVDFAGAMENRANTLDGAISNLGDTWDELFRTINKGLFGDLLLDSVRGLTTLLSGLGSGITTLGDAIERNKTQLMIWAAIFTGGALLAALPLITAAVGALTTGVIALSAAFAANPVALAIMAVTAAAVPAVNAISAMVAENKKAETATKQVYDTEVQRAAFLEANATPAQEKQIALTKEQIKEIEKQEDAYKKLIEKLREQNAELLLEEANNGKLTSQQRQALNVMLEIQNGTLKLTETRKREIVEILNANIALEAEAKKRDETKKAAEEQDKAYAKIIDAIRSNIAASYEQTGSLATLSESQSSALKILTQYSDELVNMTDERKLEIAATLEQMIAEGDLAAAYKKSDAALAAYKKTRESQLTELTKGTTALESEIAKQAEANKTYGLSKRAIGELEIAKLEEKAASMDRAAQLALEADFDAESAEQYRLQAERLRELASLKQQGVHIQIAKDSADEWKKTTDELSRGLTDALMRGFESGKGFFENLLSVLKNRFMSFVAESIIKPFMDGIAGGLTALTAPITLAVRSVVNSLMTSIGLGGAVGGGAGGVVAGGAAGVAAGGAVAAGAAGGAAGLGGLAVLGEGAGAAGAAAGGGLLGSISSGISSAASAIGPAGLAIAAAAIAASVLDGGETRKGGRYIWDQSGAKFLAGPSGGQIGYTNQMQDMLNSLAQNLNLSGNALKPGLKLYELYAGIESSKNGKGGTFLGGRWNDGTRFGDVVPNDNPGAWQFNQTINPTDALDQFQKEIEFASLDALAKIPGSPYTNNKLNPGGSSGVGGGVLESSDQGLTALATGTNLIPKDMIAMLHEGEAVVPRQYNPAIGGENVVAAEIRSLRDEVVQLRAEARSTAINSAKMARLQDNWDVRGLIVRTDAGQPLETVAA
jgi:hypothetical protein